MSKPDTSTPAKTAERTVSAIREKADAGKLPALAHYVKADTAALMHLIKKLEKPLTNPNWDNEAKLLVRQIGRCVTSLNAFKKALSD